MKDFASDRIDKNEDSREEIDSRWVLRIFKYYEDMLKKVKRL